MDDVQHQDNELVSGPAGIEDALKEPTSAPARTRRERFRAERDHVKTEANVVLRGLEEIRPDSRTVSAGFLMFERDRGFPTSLLTGAVASRLVIFLIPFLILLLVAIGLGAEVTETNAADTAEAAGLPSLFAEAATDSQAANGGLRGIALLITAVAVVWAANGLGKTLQLSYAVVWRVRRRRVSRKWLIPLVVIGFVLIATGLNGLGTWTNEPGLVDSLAFLLVEFLVIAGMWLVASRFLPHATDANRWRDFLPGALMAGVGVVAVRAAMVFYLIPKWESVGDRYGDVGIVLVMLSWAYIVGAAAVLSAHVNAALLYTRGESQPKAQERSWPLADFTREQWRRLRGSG